MATVIFYEKPGCVNNRRQRGLLAAAGHTVLPRNLFTQPWTIERLKQFFSALPVERWFNTGAPRIKAGEIEPRRLGPDAALCLMVADPLLIRRPLMQVGHRCMAGFDPVAVNAWIGLHPVPEGEELERCPRVSLESSCDAQGEL